MYNENTNESADVIGQLELEADYNGLTDTEVLLRTRNIKFQMVDKLTERGVMPSDPKDVNALMKVLDSLDKGAQTNIRNSIDQDSNASMAEAVSIIAAMEKQIGNRDPFMRDVTSDAEQRIVTVEQQLVEVDFVEGELSNEVRDLTYDGFIDDFESNN